MNSKRNFIKRLITTRYSYLFIAPVVIIFFIFVFIPVLFSFFLSFTHYNIFNPPQWVGLNNYFHIFLKDIRFWKALLNTSLYTLVVVPISIFISLVLAVMLDQKIKFKNFYKTMFFMPLVTSVVAYSVIWKWLFAGGKYGLINYCLMKFGVGPINWLMSPFWLLPAIMIMSIWADVSYNIFLFLAGLQNIPVVFYEAAEIDGAGAWYKFRHITLPLIRPILMFAVVISVINSLQLFEQVYIMTSRTQTGLGGVLDSGLSIVAYLYEKGFQQFEMGYASAIAYILFGIILVVTILNIKVLRQRFEMEY